ncbi:MAG: cell wall-binding repeat-containing protein [Lachnospiraceae bacterium]|nr:cell wall-binding repeat-containing protein [Candidatus Equihabitans merdae]
MKISNTLNLKRITACLLAMSLMVPTITVNVMADEVDEADEVTIISTPEPIPEDVEPVAYELEDLVGAPAPNTEMSIVRLAGRDRVDTSLVVADQILALRGTDKFDNIIMASAFSFPDALCGSYLASITNAPVVLLNPDSPMPTVNYIQSHLAYGGKVYALGGAVAIPEMITSYLIGFGVPVERLSGNTRYDTNLAILQYPTDQVKDTLIIAAGNNFADSLSVSSTGYPILMVSTMFNTKQWEYLRSHNFERYVILGGSGAVTAEIQQELISQITDGDRSRVVRLAGADRHATSRMIASYFYPQADKAVLAVSSNFPDGLSGSALAMTLDCPLILTAAEKTDQACIYSAAVDIDTSYVLGGESLVRDQDAYQIMYSRRQKNADGFTSLPMEALGYVPENVEIDLPGVTGEAHLLYLSDMHLAIDDNHVSNHQAVQERIAAFSSWTGNTNADKWANVSSAVDQCHAAGVMFGGDMIDFASLSNLEELQRGSARISTPMIYTRADHDLEPWWCKNFDKMMIEEWHAKVDGHPTWGVIETDEFMVVGFDNSTSPMTYQALSDFKDLLAKGKPMVLVSHVPFNSLVDPTLGFLSANAWQDRNLTWGDGTYYQLNPIMREFRDLIFEQGSPVKEILAGHLHLTWDGALNSWKREHVFSAGLNRSFGIITIK